MTTTTSPVITAVEQALDIVSDHVVWADRERRLPAPVVGALAATGVNRLALPPALAGAGAHPWELFELVERIAAVDGSAAWCTAIGAGTNVFAGYLPEKAAREVFADPDATTASIFAPLGTVTPENGTCTLNGRWPFGSNCLHAAWIGVGAFVSDADGNRDPEPRLVFAPAGEFRIHDTWDTTGLRATGSHDVSARDLPVDLARSCRFSDLAWPDEALWRMPLFSTLVPWLTAVTIGLARGALEELTDKPPEGLRGRLVDNPLAMADLAAADSRLRAARAGLHASIEDAWLDATHERPVSRLLQARILLASSHATEIAVATTGTAHRLGGGAATARSHRLSRSLNDVQTARQHLAFGHEHRVRYCRILTGLDDAAPPFIL